MTTMPQTISITIPAPAFKQIERLAEIQKRPIADVAADLTVSNLPQDVPDADQLRLMLDAMDTMDDEEIKQLVVPQFSEAKNRRLEHLIEYEEQTEAVKQEICELTEALDQSVVIRAKALSLLKMRGYDLDEYLYTPSFD